MPNFGEKFSFEIKPIVEQKLFENPAVQSFFAIWLKINDSIQLQIVDRQTWNDILEKKGVKGILKSSNEGKQALFIPKDLQLWEMIGVIEAIDRNTFILKTEQQTKAKEKIIALGKIFQNAGIYIAQRLNSIKEGQQIAKALAEEFFEYGQSLVEGRRPEMSLDTDMFSNQKLTPEEIQEIDRFLAGDALYESRKQKVEKLTEINQKDDLYEKERQKTLAQFFRAAQNAFTLEGKSAKGELKGIQIKLKPWQSDAPIHSAFLKKIERALEKQIETPERELISSIFRRGIEILRRAMPFEKLPEKIKENYLHWQNGETTLREALRIDELKKELDQIRQTGDVNKISAKEKEIADKIQKVVSSFPYKPSKNNPSEMIADQYINCIGASLLGGALMKEVGLNYLVGYVPKHSILFLITTDGNVEWRDMLNPLDNEDLKDEIIKGEKLNGEPLTVADIVAFSKNPKPEGLMFDIESPIYRKKLLWVEEGQRQYVVVFEPEYGEQLQVLNNIGAALCKIAEKDNQKSKDYYEVAIEVFKQAIALDPKYADLYNSLGNVFYVLGRYEEAIEAYKKAIAVDPKYADLYNNLGRVFYSLHYYKEAIEAYRQAIAVDPKYAYPYNNLGVVFRILGRYEEAIEAYKKAIEIDPSYPIPYYNLSIILSAIGRKEEAYEAYSKFIRLTGEEK